MNDIASGLGFLLLGGVFVAAGIDHALRFGAVKAMLADKGWPAPGAVLVAASVFEAVCGLGLVLGILRPWAALGFAGFTIAATLLVLDFWRFEGPPRDGLRSAFMINFAVLGGLLLALGQGV